MNTTKPELPEYIVGAVARGWCTPENSHKTMDSDLAYAIVREVVSAIALASKEAVPCELRGTGKCGCPTACKLNMSEAMKPAPVTLQKLSWDEVSQAATAANQAYGQFMPERWVQYFVKAYNKE
jgi:hypothetical protein